MAVTRGIPSAAVCPNGHNWERSNSINYRAGLELIRDVLPGFKEIAERVSFYGDVDEFCQEMTKAMVRPVPPIDDIDKAMGWHAMQATAEGILEPLIRPVLQPVQRKQWARQRQIYKSDGLVEYVMEESDDQKTWTPMMPDNYFETLPTPHPKLHWQKPEIVEHERLIRYRRTVGNA